MSTGGTEHFHGEHQHPHGGHSDSEETHGAAQVEISRRDRAIVVVLSVLLFVLIFRSQLAFLTAWRADNLLSGGSNSKALAVLRRGLLLTPDSPILWDMVGFGSQRLADYAGADAAYRKVLERRPDSAVTWRLLGSIQAARGRWAEAASAYDKAVGLGPDDILAWRGLALSQERSGELKAALSTWRRYAARFPGSDGSSQAARILRLLEERR